LALTAICAFFVWIYLSHTVVTVIEETAAGNKRVVWSDDPFTDWVWQAAYFAWIVGVWFVPAMFLARVLTRRLDVELRFAGFTLLDNEVRWMVSSLVAAAVFWLFFPLSLLSTMSAESRWTVLHGPLFVRLAKNFLSLLFYYLVSAVLILLTIALLYILLAASGVLSLIASGVGISVCIILVARLLGRLANRARLIQIGPRRERANAKVSRKLRKRVQVTDPWELPEDAPEFPEPPPPRFVQPSELPALQTPYEGEIVGYDVRFDDGPQVQRQSPQLTKMEDAVPMQDEHFGGAAARSAEDRASRKRLAEIEPDSLEMKRAAQRREQEANTSVTQGTAGFLFQQEAAVQCAVLALGIIVLGIMIRGIISLLPSVT